MGFKRIKHMVNIKFKYIFKRNIFNKLGDFASKIAETTWKVGGVSTSDVTASAMYTNEMTSIASGTDGLTEYQSKIALMYAHDYGFAASPTAWTTTLYNYDGNGSAGTAINSIDWLYLGSYEWLVSRSSSYSSTSLYVHSAGCVRTDYGTSSFSFAVRPVFYLISTATYSDGDGSLQSPIRLG